MNRNTSVALEPHFTRFIDAQVKEGRYASASEVVSAGLSLLEAHETKVRALQDALHAGLQSGRPRPLDFEAFKARKRAEYLAR
ncbi:type II toxin-antitoxin system ParD family antitoxin [Allofranklinella schreckenbergeri]|uniref:Type II toxin-antitoxin system ParD family antitoxin n=1 Tax=Allofranklinella schreckenbergeri TaxID=1076744 RepID=A0A3M6Q6C3_9BURK|nr:type II toxin-antitoxin system ParD family antitoxin [Allofranklinella schreckenbergeri]RMW98717.1 type II toxin-antitoxin system ParD family antitoxin [Allofranklinella schreckenbergeri]